MHMVITTHNYTYLIFHFFIISPILFLENIFIFHQLEKIQLKNIIDKNP